uniref:Uncharacterized protein n=1 Tax=Mesocestoides corti TaxID=53468 RepID=A0A5K3G5T5_MESCO
MCHLCTPMQPFQDITPITHNGYTNAVHPNTH